MSGIVKIEDLSGHSPQSAPQYVCGTVKFARATNAPDGSILQVVNEETHKVVGVYLAYNGNWNDYE